MPDSDLSLMCEFNIRSIIDLGKLELYSTLSVSLYPAIDNGDI